MMHISKITSSSKHLTRKVYYYMWVRDFTKVLGHVFGSKNMKKATIVDRNKALKNSSYGYISSRVFKKC